VLLLASRPQDLEVNVDQPLEFEMFEPLVSTVFETHVAGSRIELRLTEVNRLPAYPGAPRLIPFTLVFSGRADQMLAQATYVFRHVQVGEVAIFIVPVSLDGGDVRYEAVFN
jgi:hypothetical protein